MNKPLLICLAILTGTAFVKAQTVGISSSAFTPNSASILDVSSTTKGVLLPRMTTAERGTYTTNSALGPSHKGMTIFNTTTNRYDYWDGTQWLQMTAGVVGGALDYIQNQTGADQTAGFRINGNGLFNGGQVTIGTATPGAAGYRLTIAGAGQTFLATDNDMNWQARNSGGTYEFFLTPRGADNVTYLNYGSVGMNIRNNASANTLFLRPNNNVGVGTTSPEEALELYRSGSDPVQTFHRAGVGSYKMGTDGSVFKLAAMDNGFGGHTGNFQNNDTQVLSMINNGNVGIGNVAPSQKVQIDVSNNGLNIPLFIRNTNNTNGSNYVGIGLTNESGNNAVKSAITFERTANFGVGKLHFMLNNDAASASSVAAADIKMTIQPNGNVGIGTTSPSQHLTVQQTGTARVSVRGASTFGVLGNDPTDGPYISWVNTQPLRFSTATDDQGAGWTERMRISNAGVVRIANLANASNRMVYANSVGDLAVSTSDINPNNLVDGTGTLNYLARWTPDGNSLGIGATYDNGTNVGIGNAAPAARLDVLFTGADRAVRIRNTNDASSSNGLLVSTTRTATDAYILNLDANGTSRMYVRSDGNVGIGTTTPGSRLEINGPATGSGVTLRAGGGGDVLLNSGGTLFFDGNYSYAAGNYIRPIAANTQQFVTSGTERMRITSAGNVGINQATPTHRLHVTGDVWAEGKYVVQNSTDGGNTRGIWMWNAGDSNWGIYMGQAGGGRSLSGGTAVAGGGFSAHAIRFRVNASSSQGFIFENNSEQNLLSIRGDNGRATFRGGIQLDCTTCGSTTSVDGDGASNWGTMTIQGRVLSANSNIHLSPPGGSNVIINTSYRAAGGAGGTAGLQVQSLAGTGNRPVFADANGTLSAAQNGAIWSMSANFASSPDDFGGFTDLVFDNEDDVTRVYNLGFNVTIDGVSYSQVSVCSNGWIAFGNIGSTNFGNTALPATFTSNPVIFPYWDDLRDYGGGEYIRAMTVGTSPNRTACILYRMRELNGTVRVVHFQVQIHEGSGLINVKYFDPMDPAMNGQGATIGFQLSGAGSAKAYPIVFNGKVLDDNRDDSEGWSVSPIR